MFKSDACVLVDVFSLSVELVASWLSIFDGVAFANGDILPRGINNWFGRRRLKRDDGFNGAVVDGFSSFGSIFCCSKSDWSVESLPLSDGMDALVLDNVERVLPRKLNVGRVLGGRCVDETCDEVSIAFSSGFFSSAVDAAAVVRKLKRFRATTKSKLGYFTSCLKKQVRKRKIKRKLNDKYK